MPKATPPRAGQTGRAGVERRRAPRAEVSLPIQLSPRGEAQPGTQVNLSTSGLGCRFSESISEMTLVGIDLDLPGARVRTTVQGAVIRCDKVRGVNPPTYDIGIFFTEMSDATRAAIQGFIEQQLVPPIEA